MTEPNKAVLALREYGQQRAVFWDNPTRGQCQAESCLESDAILHETRDGTMLCASHYRAQSNRDEAYPCDVCNHVPAFRDPLARVDEMLCTDCHARNGYIPGERAMVKKLETRQGVSHPLGRKLTCIAAGHGTDCAGELKQRGKLGVLCNKHADPVKWLKGRPS